MDWGTEVRCSTRSNSSLVNGYTSHYSVVSPGNITYQCNPGYYISGQSNQSITSHTSLCLISGHWSTPEPTCVGITCMAPPPALANSSILSQELVYPGIVTYQCDVGYYVAGYAEQNVSNATVQCAPNGTWIGTAPTCLPIMCHDLPNTLQNGSVLSFGLEYTSNRTYICQHGFFISSAANFSVTSVTVNCLLNGSWSAPVPTCKRVSCTPVPLTITRARSVASGSNYFGDSVTYACSVGNYINGSGNITERAVTLSCLINGSWSDTVPACAYVPCTPLNKSLADGKFSGFQPEFGVQYNYTCNSGFHIAGSHALVTFHSIRCESDGLWSGPVPTCAAVACSSIPTSLDNGTAAYLTPSSSNTAGAAIKYTCLPGYYVQNETMTSVTSRVLSCQLDASWNGTVPTCNAHTSYCPGLNRILNGKVVATNGLALQSIALYSCLTGYKLTGPADQRACQVNKTWSGTAPACSNIDECVLGVDTCNRVNGTCTDTSGSYSCSCNPGYAGDGRQCTDDNECIFSPCQASFQSCINSVGSYSCVNKCTVDSSGEDCPGNGSQEASPAGLGVPGYMGIAAGGFVLIQLIIIIVFAARHHKRKRVRATIQGVSRMDWTGGMEQENHQRYSDGGGSIGKKSGISVHSKLTPLPSFHRADGITLVSVLSDKVIDTSSRDGIEDDSCSRSGCSGGSKSRQMRSVSDSYQSTFHTNFSTSRACTVEGYENSYALSPGKNNRETAATTTHGSSRKKSKAGRKVKVTTSPASFEPNGITVVSPGADKVAGRTSHGGREEEIRKAAVNDGCVGSSVSTVDRLLSAGDTYELTCNGTPRASWGSIGGDFDSSYGISLLSDHCLTAATTTHDKTNIMPRASWGSIGGDYDSSYGISLPSDQCLTAATTTHDDNSYTMLHRDAARAKNHQQAFGQGEIYDSWEYSDEEDDDSNKLYSVPAGLGDKVR
ncbi:sushi, von Willebrand factor type A, EGF and pentraxin domain-containing protein 1-like [Sycon ciliatum]|uniref:sushi, von Willebrand factor type A, EGF and pentraxin domain-containing protein 1-like n=1 Tax=Sycon ciliatum TaxID=27933 RepID=UPI0031F6D79D